jgi:hypothetical protein
VRSCRKTSTHYFSYSGRTGTNCTKKRTGLPYTELLFLLPVGSTGHVVHSGACGARNIDIIFFMLRSHRFGFHKKRARTPYDELVFFHPMGSVGHVLHSDVQNIDILFFMLDWDQHRFDKKQWDTLRRTCVFASGGICGSRSAFRCMKRRLTIFHARVGPVQIPRKAHQNILHQTCVFPSGRISGSLSAF